MLFEPNDMNDIHTGNYEEFFILYVDNELSEEQVKMVDEFLAAHPHLIAAFEMLKSTKLPLEEFSFNKKDLLAENMKLSFVDEDLLLYIDNELSSDQKKKLELKLSCNKDYQFQHRCLSQTKLDPSEKILYPNKKELYRTTGKMVSMKLWMRVAVAVVLIATGGIFYFRHSTPDHVTTDSKTIATNNSALKKDSGKKEMTVPEQVSSDSKRDEKAANHSFNKLKKINQYAGKKGRKEGNPVRQNVIALNTSQKKENETRERQKLNRVQFNEVEKTIALAEPEVSIDKIDVTSSPFTRFTNATTDLKELNAGNNRKGSIKGFLRRATRIIEKRTGIDATNENGELLIGAVAINLK